MLRRQAGKEGGVPDGAEFCVVLTTCATQAVLERIISALLEARLAACIQVLDVQSHYRWQDRVNHEPEHLLLIKTRSGLFAQVRDCIAAVHDYEVPEIVQLPIVDGSAAYLEWIRAATIAAS
jgi:periplasmic divalent cation tolerance protein